MKKIVGGVLIALMLLGSGCPFFASNEGSAPDEDEAQIWYVDKQAPPGGNGKTWAQAFRHPQQAVNAAISGEVVKVAQGTYGSWSGNPYNAAIRMKAGVKLYGGYYIANGEFIARNPEIYPSYLTGVLYNEDESIALKSVHIVIGASRARLDGFSIIDGDTCTNPESPTLYTDSLANHSYWGAGMWNNDVTQLRINDCRFSFNRAEVGGGAIFNEFSDVDITKCQFWYNTVWRQIDAGMDQTCYGGAIAVRHGGLVRIENSLFVSNSAGMIAELEGCGGAIATLPAENVQILHCTFAHNRAEHGYSLYDTADEFSDDLGIITIKASILWNQSIDQDENQIEAETELLASYSDIQMYELQDLYPGTGNINEDPQFKGCLYTSIDCFRVAFTSPCADGVPAAESLFDDLVGDVRNGADGWVQMGALENP